MSGVEVQLVEACATARKVHALGRVVRLLALVLASLDLNVAESVERPETNSDEMKTHVRLSNDDGLDRDRANVLENASPDSSETLLALVRVDGGSHRLEHERERRRERRSHRPAVTKVEVRRQVLSKRIRTDDRRG